MCENRIGKLFDVTRVWLPSHKTQTTVQFQSCSIVYDHSIDWIVYEFILSLSLDTHFANEEQGGDGSDDVVRDDGVATYRFTQLLSGRRQTLRRLYVNFVPLHLCFVIHRSPIFCLSQHRPLYTPALACRCRRCREKCT